jgi:hypothetical protein
MLRNPMVGSVKSKLSKLLSLEMVRGKRTEKAPRFFGYIQKKK